MWSDERLTKPVYYTVQDRGNDNYDVRGYNMYGTLLLHTWHTTKSSMEMECNAWRNRGASERLFDYLKEIR
jgi:hypothetical protein